MPALADDSGICVDALSGAPGVYSARFAGDSTNDQRNNAELLRRLAGVADRKRALLLRARAVRTADDPEPLIAEAAGMARLSQAPRGNGGFGYDPVSIFLVSA